jgi:TonB family protein
MTSTLSLRATRALVCRRSSCSRYVKAKWLTGVLLLCWVALHDSAGKPSNIFYRVSPPNAPVKLEPVVYAPHFEYPFIARKQHLEGSGVFEIHVNPDGSVTSIKILRTTGYNILDAAAITGFRRWRFRPHTIAIVRMPVQYRIASSSVRRESRTNLKNVGDGDGVVIVDGKS